MKHGGRLPLTKNTITSPLVILFLTLSLFTPQMLREATISQFSGVTEKIQTFLLDKGIIISNAIRKSKKAAL